MKENGTKWKNKKIKNKNFYKKKHKKPQELHEFESTLIFTAN